MELILSDLNLKWLPRLPSNLYILNCNRNQLTILPPLPNCLRILNCYSNKLTSLPKLPNRLRELYAGNNPHLDYTGFLFRINVNT
jgi:Leucine-rich repeat (LRR) protein